MPFNHEFKKLGQNYHKSDNEIALANIEVSDVDYSFVCHNYGRTGMHYLIYGQSRSLLFWKVFNRALTLIDNKQLNTQDVLYGRTCLHYATRISNNPIKAHQDILCLVEIASRTYHGYTLPDQIYNRTGQQYLYQVQKINNISIVNVIDTMYRILVCKIKRCWIHYKHRMGVNRIVQEIILLPPTPTFPGGQQYHTLKASFEMLSI